MKISSEIIRHSTITGVLLVMEGEVERDLRIHRKYNLNI